MAPTFTNKHGLPEALVAAVTNDPYRGGGDISVTALIDAPQRRQLFTTHSDQVVQDVSERIWALLGQAVHHILERAGGNETLVEQRLYADIEGWKLSGQFDRLHLESNTLSDYKVTTTYKKDGDKGWERQLNVLRWLAHQNGIAVDTLEIVAIFRDWRKVEADRNADYPAVNVKIIPVPVWSLEETEAYIRWRIGLHKSVRDGAVLPCTDEERWYSGTTYALMKPNAKRALRVLPSPPAPTDIPDGCEVVERQGIYRRCQSYCEVAPFCTQWQSSQTVLEDTFDE